MTIDRDCRAWAQVFYVAAQIMVWTFIIQYADNLGISKAGLWCLVGISLFMSLVFPTIYGTALENVSLGDASLGAAFLVMAIVGGALMPPLQGMIIDCGTIMGHPAVNISYCLPLLCFIVVAIYGLRSRRKMA